MSSLWFQSAQTEEVKNSANSDQEYASDLTSILAAAGNELPLLAPENLSFDKTLGRGSSFIVNRELYSRLSDTEPYYVAVKHIITADQPASRLQQHYDKVTRELRVLTHPNLKDNQYILKILAYGWTNNLQGQWPYLVVDYSPFGTLSEFLLRIQTSWADRKELALDIALGLKALHENKIVHGDVKPSNVLVFGARQNTIRNQMAKLSDFGGAIFDLDNHHIVGYGGTAIYNAPELEQRGKYKSGTAFTPEQLYQADMYSFGITLWEVMKHGKSYIDNEWLLEGETKIDFLNRVHKEEDDPLLRRAEAFCNTIFQESSISDTVLNCFRMTLTDRVSQRSDIIQIIDALTRHNTTPRPTNFAYPERWAPSLSSSRGSATNKTLKSDSKPFRGYKLVPHAANPAVEWVNEPRTNSRQPDIKVVDGVSEEASKGIIAILTKPDSSQSSKSWLIDLDLFQATLTPDPPWSIQSEVVGSWQAKATSADLSKRCQACLQLAISYYLGYGVRPSPDLTLSYLTIGLEGNDTIMMLYHRLIAALAVDVKQPNINKTFMTDLDSQLRWHTARETYFATRVYQHQQLRVEETRSARHDAIYKRHRDLALLDLVKKHDLNLLSNNLSSKKHDDIAVSRALLEASRCGNARMVQLLCVHCDMFVHDESLLTPVHWLIMFEESDAAVVANALVHGTSTNKIGPCRGNVNSLSSNEYGSLFIAEHCLELFGTPLHWAVRTRNLKLVELLFTLGADINVRTEVPLAFVTNIHRPQLPSLSPLDIAVMFHLPEIVIRLLDLGAIREGGGGVYTKSHSSFLCIGLRCTPFSRYIIHGKHYRDALKETIQVLVRKGYNINDTNANGDDPLKVALSNADCESYIIEELLNAGALPSQRTLETQENAVDVAISHAPYRRYSVENLRLVLPYVRSVSDSNSSTYNATHRAAIGGSELMVEVLSTAEGFDINAKTSVRNGGRYGGETALHLAALSESVEVIRMLVRKGANMEIPDSSQYTPLQVAIFHRKTKAADTFIALGANLFLMSLRRDTVLHVAVAGVTSGYSLVKHLLTKHPRLRKRSLLNATDHIGWTALHKAAYFGDFEAVEALLDEGADKTLMDKSRGPMPGRTPLERVEHEIWRLSIDAWDSDLKRIMAGGLQAKDHHVANLHEIALMLKDGSLSEGEVPEQPDNCP